MQDDETTGSDSAQESSAETNEEATAANPAGETDSNAASEVASTSPASPPRPRVTTSMTPPTPPNDASDSESTPMSIGLAVFGFFTFGLLGYGTGGVVAGPEYAELGFEAAADKFFALPAFASVPRVARFAPPAVGLACIPLMPLIDAPASKVLDAGSVSPSHRSVASSVACRRASFMDFFSAPATAVSGPLSASDMAF